MEKAKMVLELEHVKYEKYPNGNGVNIYVDGVEIDYFTDYSIGSDFEKFEESCKEHFENEVVG